MKNNWFYSNQQENNRIYRSRILVWKSGKSSVGCAMSDMSVCLACQAWKLSAQ